MEVNYNVLFLNPIAVLRSPAYGIVYSLDDAISGKVETNIERKIMQILPKGSKLLPFTADSVWAHYENMLIQINKTFYHQKMKIFR